VPIYSIYCNIKVCTCTCLFAPYTYTRQDKCAPSYPIPSQLLQHWITVRSELTALQDNGNSFMSCICRRFVTPLYIYIATILSCLSNSRTKDTPQNSFITFVLFYFKGPVLQIILENHNIVQIC